MSVAVPHRAAAQPTGIELADIFQRHAESYFSQHPVTPNQRKVARAIMHCRTAALGGHREWCERCGHERYRYHSCRNRHCPKCQTLAKAQWLENRQQELLPTPYFHNVFTLPHELNSLILASERNRRALLNLLFRAVADTLLGFGRKNLGGKVGFTLVLHTWDQQLRPHFHLHCVIAGGAISTNGETWMAAGKTFLFPVRALSKVFRAKYLQGLEQLLGQANLDLPASWDWRRVRHRLRKKAWIVYSKAPFAGPEKLLDYLGRYTHRVAISNHRLLSVNDHLVRFTYRDRADGDRRKIASLAADQFLRRFLMHVLPGGFMRIRHYGFLANRVKGQALAQCREQLNVLPPKPPEAKNVEAWMLELTGVDITRCPHCGAPLWRESIPSQAWPPNTPFPPNYEDTS